MLHVDPTHFMPPPLSSQILTKLLVALPFLLLLLAYVASTQVRAREKRRRWQRRVRLRHHAS